ncbi:MULTISPECIES: RNA polymerase sigma-70 factor [Maribellus]|uniref:RNA polymerase sigma-70 factor n=1 Tax=Maribellus comscasis TaxID=2681766 RepID=A0A6I6K0P1_9BACT|nr:MULTISPECIES: RNA polymerase sigma-70 factor [Maribellus]MCG6189329.1 RNA polymerase sigma-70 factor [Maribellus maritimus]QGY47010.1 RNA polymerase sigma-70 factor [Maribellus comscasis]
MKKTFKDIKIRFEDGNHIFVKDFFYSYYPVLTVFAEKYIADKSICEDIVQDVFISFWERQNVFLNIKALKAFFYKSVRNSCLDYLKHQKVEKKYMDLTKNSCHESEFFLDEVLKNETYSVIYREINKLPEMGRKVLLLSMNDNSNEEIAGQLNIGVNTVRTHKARSYKVLRAKLAVFFKPSKFIRQL